MFFFEWFTPAPTPKVRRKASKKVTPRTPYTPDGHYKINQKVEHPAFGPGTITLVRKKMVVILFDSECQNPPRLVLCGVPVQGRRFLSAPLTHKDRDKANGATFAVLMARARKNDNAKARRQLKQQFLDHSPLWSALLRRYSSRARSWWDRVSSTKPQRTGVLHGSIQHRAA